MERQRAQHERHAGPASSRNKTFEDCNFDHIDRKATAVQPSFVCLQPGVPADPAIALLGGMQSLFEASMYSFVFLWTMAMSPNKEAIKHGLIFVNFMTACMAGSFLAGVLMKRSRPEQYMKGVYFVAAAAMAVPMALSLNPLKDPSELRSSRLS